MELDKLKELLGDAEKESIKKDLEIQKDVYKRQEYEDDESSKMFYLGMISVICGIYLACQFKVSHIIAPNGYLPYYFEFTSLMLISVAVSLFIQTNVDGVIKDVYKRQVLCRNCTNK